MTNNQMVRMALLALKLQRRDFEREKQRWISHHFDVDPITKLPLPTPEMLEIERLVYPERFDSPNKVLQKS